MRASVALVTLGVLISASAPAAEGTAPALLKQAFAAAAAQNAKTADKLVREAIDDPGFPGLDPGSQHAALELAYTLAFDDKDFTRALAMAARATSLPQQSAADWTIRLHSAERVRDGREEAASITGLASLWTAASREVTAEAVAWAFRDTRSADLQEPRKQMLLALYDRHWRAPDRSDTSYLWRELSLYLLEEDNLAKASQVVILVDQPQQIIAMHADRRYERLLKAPYFESDPHRAAQTRIKADREYWAQHPRSLEALLRLANGLLSLKADDEALALTTQADETISAAPAGIPAFLDMDENYTWLLNAKADALRHLGRFDEAVTVLRRSVDVQHKTDSVSQAINLAELLCEMSRSEEALSILPGPEQASDYGRALIELVQLTAASERGDTAAARERLAELRKQRESSAGVYQKALLVTGGMDEAEAFLLSRLTDPQQRTAALLALQTYAEPKRPPRGQLWRASFEKLKAAPSIRRKAAEVGSIGRYPWRYE